MKNDQNIGTKKKKEGVFASNKLHARVCEKETIAYSWWMHACKFLFEQLTRKVIYILIGNILFCASIR